MYTPYVLDNSGGGERVFDLWSRLHKDRIIFLGEEITEHTANLIVAQLLYLETQSRVEDINLYINSPGGSVSAGLAILDTMNYIESPVRTVCVGQAASMAAVLLAAGVPGRRFCMPNASVMIHQVSGGASGQVTDMEITLKRAKMLKDKLNKILSESTGTPYERVCIDVERDYWMTAQEAITYGIVDKVLENRKKEME